MLVRNCLSSPHITMDALVLPSNVCPHCHKLLKNAHGVAKHITNQPDCQRAAAAAKALQRVAAVSLGPILMAGPGGQRAAQAQGPHNAAWEDQDIEMSDAVLQASDAEGKY